jgi:hypothetical protein
MNRLAGSRDGFSNHLACRFHQVVVDVLEKRPVLTKSKCRSNGWTYALKFLILTALHPFDLSLLHPLGQHAMHGGFRFCLC